MDRIRIVGGKPLNGTIPISGAKNATLPLMIASLLTDDVLVLENVPRLADVTLLQHILSNHGVDIMVKGKRPGDEEHRGQTLHISAARIVDTTAPYELVSKMRASFWVVGPLLARMGEAKVSLPGGCAIGTRPVDLLDHGAGAPRRHDRDRRRLCDRARQGRTEGRRDRFSQGDGRRHAHRADGGLARERRDRDRERGARAGGGRRRRMPDQDGREDLRRRHLAHRGRRACRGSTARAIAVLPDRIETGTYAMAVAMTGGDVLLEGARPELLQSALDTLAQAGAEITTTNAGIRVARNGGGIAPVEVTTAAASRASRPTCRRS